MREKTLNLLGLMRKANAIAVGETNTGGAVRAGKAKLLLLASDASDNARSRARGFTHGRDVVTVTLPFTKDENGHGPSWGFSLFEDNAEYGLGMSCGGCTGGL